MTKDLQQHERVKMQLRLRGSSLAQIARDLAVARTSVTSVCQGRHRSRRIECAIAEKLGLRPEQLWPERYRMVCDQPGVVMT
jgi:lambda repressor-like predicted transcriptional regulator